MVRRKNPIIEPIIEYPPSPDESKGERSEESGSNESQQGPDDLNEPMLPLKMHFKASDYCKPFKISSKCYIHKAVELLRRHLSTRELKWFTEDPQFGHLFHMQIEPSHRLMAMWMLLLRVTYTEKKKECWFVVNGVPIRYSLREMALISGLNCREYPLKYSSLGGSVLRDKHFGGNVVVSHADVETKLVSMKHPSPDRLKMAVLYFLSSVLIGKKKVGKNAASVEAFFLRAVDDLDLCKTFPWGRLAFEENMKDIAHLVHRFRLGIGTSWVFPSFVVPLELLAFENIPILMEKYREPVGGAQLGCPRMCKTRYITSTMKGIPITELYETLGTTKEIHSVMMSSPAEEHLLSDILKEDSSWDDKDDVIIDGWNRILRKGKKAIWFESLFLEDVSNRSLSVKQDVPQPCIPPPDIPPPPTPNEELKQMISDGFNKIHQKMADMEGRLKTLEAKHGNETVEEEEASPKVRDVCPTTAMVLYVPPDKPHVVAYTITDYLYDVVDKLKAQIDEQSNASGSKRKYTRKRKAVREEGGDAGKRQKADKRGPKIRSPVLTRLKKKTLK